MPEPLPDPPVDRTGWWRSPPPPSNPDDVATRGRRELSVVQLAAIAWGLGLLVLFGLIALVALGGPVADAATSAPRLRYVC